MSCIIHSSYQHKPVCTGNTCCVLASDGVLEYILIHEYNLSTIFWVLGTSGFRLILVLEGQCTRYSVKKGPSTQVHLAFAKSNKQNEFLIANWSQYRRVASRGGQGGIICLGGKSCWFWLEKTLKFVISARKSLRISEKTYFFGDHLLLAGKKR